MLLENERRVINEKLKQLRNFYTVTQLLKTSTQSQFKLLSLGNNSSQLLFLADPTTSWYILMLERLELY